jgi:hypothetical protein
MHRHINNHTFGVRYSSWAERDTPSMNTSTQTENAGLGRYSVLPIEGFWA